MLTGRSCLLGMLSFYVLLAAHPARFLFRSLAFTVLLALCMQMAVCFATDHCLSDISQDTGEHSGSDCGCHECACCSLHLGFPPAAQAFAVSLIERIGPSAAPPITDLAGPRLERPPRA
jgi:hypothetical protein